MRSEIPAVILAAGAGVRFGGPKALARTGGQSWLGLAVEKSRCAGFSPVCAVLGSEAARVRRVSGVADIIWVENREWERGRTGSIVSGLRALPPAAPAALIYPVDFPLVRAETLVLLRESFARAPDGEAQIFVPEYRGRRGHPILLGRAIWTEVFRLGADEPLRVVVHRCAARVQAIATADAGALRDINYREELRDQ